MTWLIIVGIVAGWVLGIIATVVWFRRMEARHDRAHVSPTSVTRAESTEGVPPVHAHTLQRIQQALEKAGAEFGRDGTTVRCAGGSKADLG